MAIPPGHVGLVWGRSGLGAKGVGVLAGCIDPGYTGELIVVLHNHSRETVRFQAGDRVAQLLILPVAGVGVVEVTALAETDRGGAGFGSTGA